MPPKKSTVAFSVALNQAFPESPKPATPKATSQPKAAKANPAVETPTPPAKKRGGGAKKQAANAEVPAKDAAATELQKKRGRAKKQDQAPAAEEQAAPKKQKDTGAGEPQKKRGRKEAAADTAPVKEEAPEPALKKGKSSSGALKLPVERSGTPRAASEPPPDSRLLKLLSINVAGLRSVLGGEKAAALKATVEREAPDVLCLNEHKLKSDDVEEASGKLKELLPNYAAARWSTSSVKKGYSGVAVLLREPDAIEGAAIPDPAAVVAAATEGMGGKLDEDPAVSQEGRLITLELPEVTIVAVYVPNSGTDLQRLAYRTGWEAEKCWDRALSQYVRELEESKAKPVVVLGDLNCAHRVQDMWNMHERPDFPEGLAAKPVEAQYTGLTGLKKVAGNTPEERASFSRLLESAALVDTFRAFHPQASGVFSYFSQRFAQNRPLNRGLRLDYALASRSLCAHLPAVASSPSGAGAAALEAPAAALPRVHDSFILDQCEQVADHSAVGCWLLLPAAAPAEAAPAPADVDAAAPTEAAGQATVESRAAALAEAAPAEAAPAEAAPAQTARAEAEVAA